MKQTIKVEKEINIKYVIIDVPVRYEEEDMPNDFPFRENNRWKVTVDIDTGIIENWNQGVEHDLFMKVTDCGIYTLLDENRQEIKKHEYYVPHGLILGEFGDYIELGIDKDGKILNWYDEPCFDDFFRDDD